MPRPQRRVIRHLAMPDREPEIAVRYRPREVTPPGTSRHREEIRERELWVAEEHLQRRSPHNERRRSRNSPRRSADRLRHEASREELVMPRGDHQRSTQMRASPRIETQARPSETKSYEDRFTDRPEPSQGISPTSGYPNQYRSNRPDNTPDGPVIPEFNPESSKLTSTEWLQLVESTAVERFWKQDEKLYILISRLGGFARQWYLTSGINYKSWSELKSAFLKAFPSELDYHFLLKKMLARVKEDKESVSTYILHKVSLLNACQIQGVKAVSCIIAGLSSSKLQEQARMEKCADADQLYLFLRSLTKDDSDFSTRPANNKSDPKPDLKPDKGKIKKGCYFCGHITHVVANCRQIKKHKCTVCHKIGHECEPLSLLNPRENKKRVEAAHNQVMEGSLSLTEVQQRCFTEVFINGIVFKAYVDLDSESITIKEENAIETRLSIKKQYRVVRGFAGAALSTVGHIDTSICIDRAMADVRLFVVPDHLQSIPVVIGQGFTQQPHVVLLKDAGGVRFYERMDNGNADFDF